MELPTDEELLQMLDDLITEKNLLKRKLVNVEAQRDTLAEQIADCKVGRDVTKLETEISRLRGVVSAKQNLEEKNERIIATVRGLNKDLSNCLETARAELKEHTYCNFQKLKDRFLIMEVRAQSLENETVELKHEIETRNFKISKLKLELKEHTNCKLQKIKNERIAIQGRLNDTLIKNKELGDAYDKSQAALKRSQDREAILTEDNHEYVIKNEEQYVLIKRLKKQCKGTERSLENMKRNFGDQLVANQMLMKEIASLKKMYKKEVYELTTSIEIAHEEFEIVSKELGKVTMEKNRYFHEYGVLQKKLIELEDERDKLKATIDFILRHNQHILSEIEKEEWKFDLGIKKGGVYVATYTREGGNIRVLIPVENNTMAWFPSGDEPHYTIPKSITIEQIVPKKRRVRCRTCGSETIE